MSPIFLKSFRRKYKCPSCPAKKVTKKSMCGYHLRVAREKWASWAQERQARGLCSYCNRKSVNGWLRCRVHAEYNRKICLAWVAENKEYRHQYEQSRAQAFQDQGLCRYCAEHRPLGLGKPRCDPCYEKMQIHRLRSDLREIGVPEAHLPTA